jgi:fructose-1,6-bisphosphatase/inositol monophosphatase family enzyme
VMSAWDIAPLYPIIEEAGGKVSSFSGERAPLGTSLVAASAEIHEQILALLG